MEATIDRRALVEREERLGKPVGVATFLAVALYLAGSLIAQGAYSTDGDGEAALLKAVDIGHSNLLVGVIFQVVGIMIIAAPLLYLFRATSGRMPVVRSNLFGLVIAAPIFVALAILLATISNIDAASDFVANPPKASLSTAAMDDAAQNLLSGQSLRPAATGFGIAGAIGFAFAMIYTCLYATRAGLLSRFWGTLGMALGAASFLLFQFAIFWFVYLGMIALGVIRGGRPPAWEAGIAIPWPTPGEEAAAGGGVVDGKGSERKPDDEVDSDDDAEEGNAWRNADAGSPHSSSKKRKRKRRR